MALTSEQVAELDEATAPVDPDTSAEPEAEASTAATPPAEGEASESDSAPEAEGDKAKETPEQKAEREKQELIAKRWKVVEEAKKEHLRVARKQKDLEAATSKLEQERQQFALQQQQHASLVREAQSVLETIARVRANPSIEGLRALGFDYMTLTTQMVEANTPEAIAKAAAEEARRVREEREREKVVLEMNRADGEKLILHAEENEDLYPELASMSPERIAHKGIALRDKHLKEHGRYPTYQWVIEQIHEEAKARAAKRAGGTTSEKTQASTNGTGPRATGPTGKPTLGNAASTTRVTPPREMTEAEKDAWAIEQLRALKQGAR
jgi:hypothetical protein